MFPVVGLLLDVLFGLLFVLCFMVFGGLCFGLLAFCSLFCVAG